MHRAHNIRDDENQDVPVHFQKPPYSLKMRGPYANPVWEFFW